MIVPYPHKNSRQPAGKYAIVYGKNDPTVPLFQTPKHILFEGVNMFDPEEWSIKDFEIGRHLGKGKYGHVYLARERKSKYVVALKVQLKKQLVEEQALSTISKEIEIQSHLDHPNILKMFGFFHDQKRIVQILEYSSGGELYDRLMRTERGFDQRTSSKYIRQFIDALSYLHTNDIAHRDIKPENILLDGEGNIKLADFGFATKFQRKRKSYCGTLLYMSPEILMEDYYDKGVDIWALGVLAFELSSARAPFEDKARDKTKKNILLNKYTFPHYFSEELKDFITKLLQIDKSKRMNLEQAREHEWIRMHRDI